ncbi:MAG: protoheme IX farnesyltransferase [Dehalococcoidaceae bacterium]|nr:protoheme IX farnesyltransferase [Dehalococcoidaceae bacterium]
MTRKASDILKTDKLRRILQKTFSKCRYYWSLIKSWQTGLLLVSGLAGYLSGSGSGTSWCSITGLTFSLFLSISGSTVLNMVYDQDIDSRMQRTKKRPIPAGMISAREGLKLGIVLALGGLFWAFTLDVLYGSVVLAGLVFNGVVYTLWLKRRSPWSILWGGIAGGMPVLAGRVLSTGAIDLAGILLVLAVLFWIPTHIMTFSIRYKDDYRLAGVPVFPNRYSKRTVNTIIGLSTCLAAAAFLSAAWLIGLHLVFWWIMAGLGGLLLALALVSIMSRSSALNFFLFKAASVYMLIAMLLIMLGV